MSSMPDLSRSWQDVLLSRDAKLRLRLVQSAIGVLVMSMGALAMYYALWVGLAPLPGVLGWTVLAVGGYALILLGIRSGWSRRFADPTLTVAQMVLALLCAALAYAVVGDMRGAVFPTVMVTLMFSMFALTPRQVHAMSLFAIALLGTVMVWMVFSRPGKYPSAVEFGHFLVVATMLPVVSLLALRLSRLRQRLELQKDELASALSRIQQMATRDELTGLPNRRLMAELMDKERQRGVRSGSPFCIAVIDIDHFKQVNDNYGHAAGDEVLRRFAHDAISVIRANDVLGRWGGEEFLLMLPDTRVTMAAQGVERLRARVQQMTAAPPELPQVTVSVGVTEHRAGEPVEQTIARADQAMYQAKLQGRNRVVMA